MKILNDISLASYTTMKIGGIAKKLYFPETISDLEEILNHCEEIRILGNGSNLLINDESMFQNVICLKAFNHFIRWNGEYIEAGSGVSLHSLIEEINEHGYGGIEYLYSVPGLLGGGIAMNAGRGAAYHMAISDYLVSVKVMQQRKIVTLSKEECHFAYRDSRFKNGNEIILSAIFAFDKIDKAYAEDRRKERMSYAKEIQDLSYPNLGSTFCKANPLIMGFMSRISFGRRGIYFSKKTKNWLQNKGKGTFRDAMFCIKVAKWLHKILDKECQTEYVIWK